MEYRERYQQIEHSKRQFEVHKMYALYWQTKAVADPEKASEYLETMKRHIRHMADCNDHISELMASETS